MSLTVNAACPRLESATDYALLREVLRKANYTRDSIRALFGRDPWPTPPISELLAVERQMQEHDPLNVLFRLFILGSGVPVSDVQVALQPSVMELLVGGGILFVEDDRAFAAIKLHAFDEYVFASDGPHYAITNPPRDWVMGIGHTTQSLLGVMLRRQFGRVLDIGTGCGVFAILVAKHAGHVDGIDNNVRAIKFAEFNVRVNQVANVTVYRADLVNYTNDERFDYIICNPPFVIAPASPYLYRSIGNAGANPGCCFLTACARSLNDGGHAQMVCDWPHIQGQDWRAEIEAFIKGLHCSAWIKCHPPREAQAYAEFWIRNTEVERHSPEFGNRYDLWMKYFHGNRIERISNLVVLLQRNANGQGSVHFEDAHEM
jgi:SAM-dependent methyltransferase